MEESKHSQKFESIILKDGSVKISGSILKNLNLKPGTKVTVTLIKDILSKKLTQLNVTEEEIEKICATQLENRENVIRFLNSEGSFSNNKNFIKNLKLLK